MNVKDLMAESHVAFMNRENEKALDLAKQAIKLEPKNANAYKCAANVFMSLKRYDDAVKNYSQAVKLDPTNGNRYYDLGFACATHGKLADAIKAFAKAEELGCIPENLVQLYHVLGMVCFDIGRYEDALIHLSKAEQLIGLNMDIMKRKVAIYGTKNDIRNGLQTANQMKLIAPSEYVGYKVAFKLLIQAKHFDIAAKELEIARKYSKPSMDYYIDVMTLELQQYQEDKSREHFDKALSAMDIAVKSLKPKVRELIDAYINSAEINLQLEKADQAIACLNAALNPIDSFNNHFELMELEYSPVELSDYDVEEMIEADRVKIAEELGDYGLEELAEKIEPDEDGSREYFTEIPEKPEETLPEFKLDKTDVIYSGDDMDRVNRIFVGAYTLKKDYGKVIEYAKRLQTSGSLQHAYIGKYVEANAMKELGSSDATKKYLEIIMFFRNAMIKDPSDMSAVSFRIQSCIDIGKFDEAERLCSLLTEAIREPMLKKIEDAKLGGE